jgi:proton-dependent oligopeptide transporter, POT family
MAERTPFPRVFWVANLIEILERFSYYGIYFGFGVYMTSLGYSRDQLGVVQTIFLLLSYTVPLFSGTFADRYGFKKVFIVSYLAYLPSILLLIFTKTFSGIALTMLSIGLAAGIFKPLVSATVRATTDRTNATLGFGIFYAMVNTGGTIGPVVAGRLRAISWNYAFYTAAAAIVVMLIITVLFYKEPPREIEGKTVGQKLREIGETLANLKFSLYLLLLGLFFWIPFWAFFNLCALYTDSNLDTARLYEAIRGVFGTAFANFLSQEKNGVRHILGETISTTGYIIMILQVFIARIFEKFKPIPSFLFGLFMMAAGFVVIGLAHVSAVTLLFVGILLFAIGEMISSPRIQEYITWIAPKEKAGLYMGSNFLAVGVGSFSGLIYTPLYGRFSDAGTPEKVWYVLAGHLLVGIVALLIFQRVAGGFVQQEE